MPHRASAPASADVELSSLLDDLGVIVYTLDGDGRVRSVSDAIRLLGYSPDDLIGRELPALIPYRLDIEAEPLEREPGRGVVAYETTAIAKDGRQVSVRILSAPLYEDGRVGGIRGIACPVAPWGGPHHAGLLTPRQHEVLRLLAEGLGTSSIAARLGIAEDTARNHIRALIRELGCHSRLEAVARARGLGLL